MFRFSLMTGTAVAGLVLFAAAPRAQPVAGPYVSLGVGYNSLQSEKAKSFAPDGSTAVPIGANVLLNGGFTGEAAAGYGFGNGFRVELEGDYFNNKFRKVDLLGTQYNAGGTERKYGAMVNAYYDFDIGSPYIYPFVGAGIGYQWISWNNGSDTGGSSGLNGTVGRIAYQGIAGLAFPIPGAPGLSAEVQYRYLNAPGNRNYAGYDLGFHGTYKIGRDSNDMVIVGLRYEFFPPGPPAPPRAQAPAAAPAPAPARTYLVFFNWDSTALTPRAKQIVGEAARTSRTARVTRLNVNGYTDTSGSARYNMRLSLLRADSVAAALVTDGVSKQDIAIQGFGETHLLVPTGPGVREPQNRRVEIILH